MIHPSLGYGEETAGSGGKGVPVVLLTGADRLSLDSAVFSLVDSHPSVCSVVYDVRPDETAEAGISIVRNISRAGACGVRVGESETLPVDDCCLSCSVKRDAGRALERLHDRADAFLIVLPVGMEAVPAMQYLEDSFRLGAWGEAMRIAAIADVVGLDEFEERFFDDDRLCMYGVGEEGVFDVRSTGAVVARLIHEASHVLQLPVVGAGCLTRHVDAVGECRCREIVRAVASRDAVVHEDAHDVSFDDLTVRSVDVVGLG
ncbi:hypothetical protein [Bifidobacterium aesculapii]|uniref:hypothetical protein n=1 Tax=Bifidobacterium aesculapii TaxID=1329411 RepID=UPI0006E22825|nr:hypothetical protein [Bifidobacterium aesculapii]